MASEKKIEKPFAPGGLKWLAPPSGGGGPSWEANSRSASQEILAPLIEHEGSLTCSQEPLHWSLSRVR
jgi:hypothetical protein